MCRSGLGARCAGAADIYGALRAGANRVANALMARDRFDGDPGVIGRTMRLGKVEHTIVGVMPEGFAFPVNHRYWIPLRANPGAALAPAPEGVWDRIAGSLEDAPAPVEEDIPEEFFDPKARIFFNDRIYFMGYLSDTAVFNQLIECTFLAAFFALPFELSPMST